LKIKFHLNENIDDIALCNYGVKTKKESSLENTFIGLAYQGKDIMFKFIIEYSSLRDFGP
jgi:hypothetical protein